RARYARSARRDDVRRRVWVQDARDALRHLEAARSRDRRQCFREMRDVLEPLIRVLLEASIDHVRELRWNTGRRWRRIHRDLHCELGDRLAGERWRADGKLVQDRPDRPDVASRVDVLA